MNKIIIRKEKQEDYKNTEHMVMRAFWNIHEAGCNEHLLLNKLRKSDRYIPSISLVAELDGKIVGGILYSEAVVKSKDNNYKVITFGPLAVEPTLHSAGVGRMLLEESIKLAKEQGYIGICIYGEPEYYPKHGFKTCDHYNITDPDGNNYDALMAYPLNEEEFAKVHGKLYEDDVFEECNDKEEIEKFNEQFPYYKPLKLSCQWLHKERLGRISEVQKNLYTIKYFEKDITAKLKGSFLKDDKELPVVGDYVTFNLNPYGDSVILEICERKSFLKRPDQSGHAMAYVKTMKEQNMVANFDYAFIVSSLNDNYNLNRIARYVSVTLQGNGIPVVILTKADLCPDTEKYINEIKALSDKVKVHVISALFGLGMEELNPYLQKGITIALIGSSGVGKSTLVNAIAGKEIMKTSGIREKDSMGRHTTTHREMIVLDNDVTIIDTPGMREIGMCDVEEGIDDAFSDIKELECKCKFSDCKHDTEPHCAIKKALEDGTLSKERYKLYLKLQKESLHSAKMKAISKARKKLK